jgi:hypothetical protein
MAGGLDADEQALGYLPVGEPLGDQTQHLNFPLGQELQVLGTRSTSNPQVSQERCGRIGVGDRPQSVESCHAAYLKANPKVRRRFNDAVLKAVYVEDGKIKRAEFTDVFAALFSRPSSNKWVKVPPAGFEPATPGLGNLCSIP